MFDRVYCVNLDRRPDQWRQFAEGLPADWPFPPPVRVAAVDGQTTAPPAWWTAGRGAWGCYRSHLGLIERCLSECVDSVLLLEDDALFVADFAGRAADFLRHIPDDWQLAYLGGQHIKHRQGRPRYVRAGVYRPYNVNRTHAWALRGEGLRIVRDWLTRQDWKPTHHIDHRLGQLIEENRINCYAPPDWLVKQRGHHSTIAGRELTDSTWRGAAAVAYPAIFAVLGQFRGGTSCVAGVLDALGVSAGRRYPKILGNIKGTFEDNSLARICRAAFHEPSLAARLSPGQRIRRLRRYARRRGPGIWAAKHPSLCLCVPQLAAAWPDVRFVAVDRPAAESVASIRRRRWGWTAAQAEHGTRRLIETRDRDLVTCGRPTIRVAYHDLLADPAREVDRLIEFCGLDRDEERIRRAIEFVDPAMQTIHRAANPAAAG